MVKIPTPETQGASPIGNVQMISAQTPYQTVQASGWGRQGAQLQEFGNALGALGGAIAQQQQDIALLEAQKQIADFERAAFDPHTGIYTQHGANAMGASERLLSEFNTLSDGLLKNGKLTGANRRAVERYLLGQRERIVGKATTHEYGEGQNYQKGLLAANTEAAVDRFVREINDPEAREANLLHIENSVLSEGNFAGASGPAVDRAVQDAQTSAILSGAQEMSRYSPVKAMEYLEAYRDVLDPEAYVEAAAKLEPAVKEWNGQMAGRAAFYVSQAQDKGLYGQFGMNLGRLMAEAEAQFGAGAITINSGYRTPQEQAELIAEYWGNFDLNPDDKARWVADVNIMGPVAAGEKWADVFTNAKRTREDGYGTPMRSWIALPGYSNHQRRGAADLGFVSAAARQWVHENAAKYGLHFRLENESWHIEPIGGPEFGPGGGTAEEIAAAAMLAIDATSGAGPNEVSTDPVQQIMAIADPTERAAAMSTFTQMHTFQQQAETRQRADLYNGLVADINQAAADGSPLDPSTLMQRLTYEDRFLLGAEYDSIKEYARKIATGEYITTTPEGQRKITQYLAMATSPDPAQRQQFLSTDFVNVDLNDISEGDRQVLLERQASMRSAQQQAAQDAATFPYSQSTITSELSNYLDGELLARGVDPASDDGKALKAILTAQTTTQLERQWRDAPGSFTADPLRVRDTARLLMDQRIGAFDPAGPLNRVTDQTYTDIIADVITMSPDELAKTEMTIPVRRPDGTTTDLTIPPRMMRALVDVYTGAGISAPDDIVTALLSADYAYLSEMARRHGGEFAEQADANGGTTPQIPTSP